MNVQVSKNHACTPRDNHGPYAVVEVDSPSSQLESVSMAFRDAPDLYRYIISIERANTTVFVNVPADTVSTLVQYNSITQDFATTVLYIPDWLWYWYVFHTVQIHSTYYTRPRKLKHGGLLYGIVTVNSPPRRAPPPLQVPPMIFTPSHRIIRWYFWKIISMILYICLYPDTHAQCVFEYFS